MASPLEIRFTELVIRPYPGRSASDCTASARRRSNASLFAASTVRYPESRSCAVHALKEKLAWNYLVAFAFLGVAAFFAFAFKAPGAVI
jgi:hypothetical protein